MLKASNFTLRPVREADLSLLPRLRANLENLGDYFPHFGLTEHDVRQAYQRDGMWSQDHGVLLMIDEADAIVGEIGFFKPYAFWNTYELYYIVFDPAVRGKGITSEATRLLVRYLFEQRLVNRIQLQIHPDNAGSRRVAEKCGFSHEGTLRGVWYHRGAHHDMMTYAVFRDDVID